MGADGYDGGPKFEFLELHPQWDSDTRQSLHFASSADKCWVLFLDA